MKGFPTIRRCTFQFASGATSPLRPLYTLVAVVAMMAVLPATAFAGGGSVRYSYEKIDLPGGTQWGLVPEAERKALGGTLSKSKLFDAFNLLKDDKKATYGHSSIQITGQLGDDANIVVKIDKSKALKGFAPIIMAETVYTLTEMGSGGVQFPGHFDGVMTRKDVPFYAYSLTLPLWRALPVGSLNRGQVRLPDGTLMTAADFKRRWNDDDPALRKALFSYLDDTDGPQTFTLLHVLKRLPTLDVDYVGHVIPLLEHDAPGVRRRALSVLAAHRGDQSVLEAVETMVESDTDRDLARAAAEFLGQSDVERYAIVKPLFMLDKGSSDESIAAANALGDHGDDKRSADALVAHLTDKRADVAAASAAALASIGAEDARVEALQNIDIAHGLRLKMAAKLADEDATAAKLAGLGYLVAHRKGRGAELALRRLGEVDGPKAREAIEGFLGADSRRKRVTAARVLVERGNVAAMPALADAVESAENAAELEELAYKLMVAQPLADILKQSDSSNGVVKRVAYRALGERAAQEGGDPAVFEKLAAGAKSSDPAIRGASSRALGAFANDKSLAILKTLADDDAAAVRAGVAHGLSNYEGGQMFDTLAGYLDDDSPAVVAAAVDAMAARKEATSWDAIKELADASDPEVRSSALTALAKLVSRGDKEGVRNVISLLSGAVSDDNRQVQLTAIGQLGTFDNARATTGIAIDLNAADANLRVAAVEALGETGNPNATELVVSVLEDPNPDIRRAAIEALGKLEAKSATPQLKALLAEEKDADLKSLIKQTLRKI